jgi:hypothetical protein
MAGRPSLGTRNLDEEIGPFRAGVESLGGGESSGRVVSQQGRDLQGNPAVHTVRQVVDRPKEIGGLPEVLDCQSKNSASPDLPSFNFWLMASS